MKIILVDAINTFIIKGQGIDREIFDLLETFPNKKVILTNATKERMTETDFQNLPYEVFTLENNPSKTDPEYYKKLLTHFDLNTSEVVYFEHNPEAIKSAESMGIKTHHFDPEKRDIEELKNFIKSNL